MGFRVHTTRREISECEEHQTALSAEIASVTKSLSTVTHAVVLLSNIANKECSVKVASGTIKQDFHLGDVRDRMKSERTFKTEKLSWLRKSLDSEVHYSMLFLPACIVCPG